MLSGVKIPELHWHTMKDGAKSLREAGMLDVLWLEGQEDTPWTKVLRKTLFRGALASLKIQR